MQGVFLIMSKVSSVLRKHAKLILISAVVIAFIVVFAILNTESAIEIVKLFGISALFTLGAIVVAVLLGIPSIIFKIKKKRPARFGSVARVALVILFIVLILAPMFILDAIPYGAPDPKTGEYKTLSDREFAFKLPQGFVEEPYSMTFGIYSFILCGVILAFAGNLMILSWENHDNVSNKVFKIAMGVLFAILLHGVLVYLDYLSTMLSLDYFTTVAPVSIIGMYVGFGVYGKIQDHKDRKLRAKGL